VRLLRRLTRVPQVPTGNATQPANEGPTPDSYPAEKLPPPLPWIERKLGSGGFFGTPDLVEEINGQLRVVDLKSGVHQKEITTAQRRQLLIYAKLVQTELDRLPDVCVVRDARGTETTLSVTQDEVESVATEADIARADFNNSIALPNGAPTTPGPEVCRWCEYRPVCSGYWRTRDAAWPSYSNDVVGVVTHTRPAETQIREMDTGESRRLILSTHEQPADRGDLVVLVDGQQAGFQTTRLRWDSRVRVVPAPSS
jgi:hypothetical protein